MHYNYDKIENLKEISMEEITNSGLYYYKDEKNEDIQYQKTGTFSYSKNQPKKLVNMYSGLINIYNKGLEFRFIDLLNLSSNSTMGMGFRYHMAQGAGLPGYLVGAAITGAASLVKNKITGEEKPPKGDDSTFIPFANIILVKILEINIKKNLFSTVQIPIINIRANFDNKDINVWMKLFLEEERKGLEDFITTINNLIIKEKKGLSQKFKPSSKSNISSNQENSDIPDKIKHLAKLKEQGILTEDEFQKKKKELLDLY